MHRRFIACLATVTLAFGVAAALPSPARAVTGGPIVLMGIDAEDGGPGGHGPPATYTNLVNNIQLQVTKVAANPLLVIGCNKSPFDNVSTFWDTVAPVHDCVNGAAAISAVDFTLYRMIAVVSDEFNTPFGGLTCGGGSEDAALDARAADIATHVNAGGGLLGFSSDCPVPFGYVSGLGTFSIAFPPQYDNIDPTAAGLAIGVNDTLDVCCWHDIFTTFPTFLTILAYRGGTQDVAAIGGQEVVIPPPQPTPTTLTLDPKTATNPVGTEHCVTATVRDQFGDPMAGITVQFQVTGSVNTTGSAKTDANGQATFCYTGPDFPGADAISAYADTDNDTTQDPGEPSDVAEKTWVLPISTPGCEVKITNGGWIIASNGDKSSFGGNAKADGEGNASGNEEYQDHGPAQPMNLHGNVLVVTCDSATSATIYGEATIDGAGSFIYRLRVEDNAEPGKGADKYWITVDNGYDSGNKVLKGGNVQIHKT